MSMYLVFDGVMGQQVASNKGWGDFCRWVDSLSGLRAGGLRTMVDKGEAEIAAVKVELILGRLAPDPDVERIRRELLQQLRENPDAKMVGVSDGLGK